LWIVAAALAFGALATVHARVLQRVERGRRAAALYERGLDRVSGNWHGAGRPGGRFLDGPPHARDLDLFGHASLFELLNAARTETGEETLAAWLGSTAALDEVLARQAAIIELRPNLDFREDVAVLAAEGHIRRTGALALWAQSEPVGFSRVVPPILGMCAAVTVTVALLAYYEILPVGSGIAWRL